jgi:hypothetical protein
MQLIELATQIKSLAISGLFKEARNLWSLNRKQNPPGRRGVGLGDLDSKQDQ